MELVSAYMYNTAPIDMTNIAISTIERLKSLNWFEDERTPKKFKILNKRFNINDAWYRVVLRFKVTDDVMELDTPVPFMIVQSEQAQSVSSSNDISIRFKDIKAWHGRDVKTTIGYFQAGVPVKLINNVVADLKECVIYNGVTYQKEGYAVRVTDEMIQDSSMSRVTLDIGTTRMNPIQMININSDDLEEE